MQQTPQSRGCPARHTHEECKTIDSDETGPAASYLATWKERGRKRSYKSQLEGGGLKVTFLGIKRSKRRAWGRRFHLRGFVRKTSDASILIMIEKQGSKTPAANARPMPTSNVAGLVSRHGRRRRKANITARRRKDAISFRLFYQGKEHRHYLRAARQGHNGIDKPQILLEGNSD